jgi:DNA-binding SARP family transcriptional activator
LVARIEIRLFGQVTVQRDGRPLPGLSAKALELLCYLLLQRERGHTRETLAGLLWPEAADSLAKKYLRQAIWQLQAAVASRPGPAAAEEDAFLMLRPGWLRVNPRGAWWLDVAAFEQAYGNCRDTPGERLADPDAQRLEAAVGLYGGDLIEAWYQDWCSYERDRLQLTYLAMLEKLMGYCETRQVYAKGIAFGQRILRYDPARESTYRCLMRLYYRAGDRTTAMRQYDRCAAAVSKHFGLQPARETTALYHQVRADQLGEPPRPGTIRLTDAAPGGDLLLGLQRRLDHVQESLTALQGQVQQELASISQVLTRAGDAGPDGHPDAVTPTCLHA